MSDRPLHVLAVVGSLNQNSVTRVVLRHITEALRQQSCSVDLLDLRDEPLTLFDPELFERSPTFVALQSRVVQADVYVLGTPDYHGSISGVMKNFLDHFWTEFSGKLFVPIVASHEKGLTVVDQMRTVARQCYAWALPYALSFVEGDEVSGGQVVSEKLQRRLDMTLRDLRVYGQMLARQRAADLAGTDAGFMARHRKKT